MLNIIVDESDPQNNEILLRKVDCQLKLITFITFLFNYQEKHHCQSLPSLSAEDRTQV